MTFWQRYEREEAIDRPRRSNWLTVYSDLMTTLMVFFLLLYAFSLLEEKNKSLYEEALSSIQTQFGGKKNIERYEKAKQYETEKKLTTQMQNFVEKTGLKKFVEVNINEDRIKIVMQNPVLFDLGKDTLKPAALKILDEITTLITHTVYEVIVEGHTDNIPIKTERFPSNWELSSARAFSVINYFIKEKNINPKRFSACGYGEYRPAFPNDAPEHQALNRRIEINILRREK